MATYRVQYVDGYRFAGGADLENVAADGFKLNDDGSWMDFLDRDNKVILRVRAEHIQRIELVASTTGTAEPPEFDVEEEELAG